MRNPTCVPTISLTILAFVLCRCSGTPEGVAPAAVPSAPGGDPAGPVSPVVETSLGEAALEPPEAPEEEGGETTTDGVTLDRKRGEVRFPCRFVNPTRLLEVFACHSSGPTHETVLEFDVTGPSIYRGLRALGLRSARYWNGTSPSDFERTHGDRVLVLVRWEAEGKAVELPAEGMLVDGRSGFPAFLRGFSLSTRGLLPEERPVLSTRDEGAPDDAAAVAGEPEIPPAVEISLGATNRQSPSYSLLTHETNFPRVIPWTAPPELDADAVGDHAQLVEKEVAATLIIRPLHSEVELVALARALDERRGLTGPGGRGSLHDRIEPLAREIDELKAEYQDLLEEIREMIAEGDPAERGETERAALAERAVNAFRRGQWLCARIDELYLKRYALQEESKALWAEGQADLEPEVKEEIRVASDGVSYEPRLAEKRVEIATLELEGSDLPPGEQNLRRGRIETEMSILELERDAMLATASLRDVRRKLRTLDPVEDSYPHRLFQEDERHFAARTRLLGARIRAAKTELAEIDGTLRGTWDDQKASVLAERAAAKDDIRCAELEEELVKVLAEIRWEESDVRSDVPERQKDARERLDGLLRRKSELESSLADCAR